jgi:N-acetylneuraminic acid mutarotase
MTEGPDGHSLVLFGGWYQVGAERTFYNDVWILDTCTMDWTQQTVSGTAPIGRGGHEAVRVGNYMIILGGMSEVMDTTRVALLVFQIMSNRILLSRLYELHG